MEQKTNALKTSGKVISVIMKVGYIVMIAAMCFCVASLIFMAATGGKTAIALPNGTTIGVADGVSTEPAELIAVFIQLFVLCGFLFVIFLLVQKMFGEISATGDPFTEKHARTVRTVGILIAVMTVVTGITGFIINTVASVEGIEAFTEAPGIVFGAVIFCLSYIIDYGCALKQQSGLE